MVENNKDEYPFPFLATYSTGKPGDKKAAHTPLKNALLSFDAELFFGDDKITEEEFKDMPELIRRGNHF